MRTGQSTALSLFAGALFALVVLVSLNARNPPKSPDVVLREVDDATLSRESKRAVISSGPMITIPPHQPPHIYFLTA